MSEALGFVSSVNIYPIKSCQSATVNGEQPRSLGVGLTGFEVEGIVDRQFLICEPNGLFVSQRGQDENKSLIHATDRMLATVQTDIQKDHLNITVNGFGNLQLPTETDAAASQTPHAMSIQLDARRILLTAFMPILLRQTLPRPSVRFGKSRA